MADSLARVLRGAPVRVGTENPAKLGAVRMALAAFADRPEALALQGVSVPSGVPDQPVGWLEIMAGARNRARAALASGDCALAVGIEDGLVELPLPGEPPSAARPRRPGRPPVFNIGCAWVTDGEREGTGFSSGFAYPTACLGRAFRDREPIGALFDALWRAERGEVGGPPSDPAGAALPSGRQGGNIGMLTQGRLDRSAYGAQAILCALVPFLHADLYD